MAGFLGNQPPVVPMTSADIVDGTVTADDLNSTLNLSSKTVTLPASSVTSHVTSFDDSDIRSDILKLALHQAIDGNRVAFNLEDSFVDGFESDSGIATETSVDRDTTGEYVSTGTFVSGAYSADANTTLLLHMEDTNFSDSSTASTKSNPTINGSVSRSSAQAKFGTYSCLVGNSSTGADRLEFADHADWDAGGSTNHTIDFWIYLNSLPSSSLGIHPIGRFGGSGAHGCYIDNNGSIRQGLNAVSEFYSANSVVTTGSWQHCAIVKNGSSDTKIYVNGTQVASGSGNFSDTSDTLKIGGTSIGNSRSLDGYIDEVRISNIARWTSSFTPNDNTTTVNSTGSFTSNTITPQDSASKSSLGLVILYKNNAGTNTLNTDVICKVSADNGSNYSTCVLASKGTFSTGINIAIAPAISVTAGTQLKYKVEFANQASGSKEAQIHGAALQY